MVMRLETELLNFLNLIHGISLVGHVDILMQYVKVARYMLGIEISFSGTLPSSDSMFFVLQKFGCNYFYRGLLSFFSVCFNGFPAR
jgi:hypothetical protein